LIYILDNLFEKAIVTCAAFRGHSVHTKISHFQAKNAP